MNQPIPQQQSGPAPLRLTRTKATGAAGPSQQQQQALSEEADSEGDDGDDALMEVDGPSEPQDAEEKQNSKGENELVERRCTSL